MKVGTVEKWDALFQAVLGCSGLLKRRPSASAAVRCLSLTRNSCAHAVNGRIQQHDFEASFAALRLSLVGGDSETIDRLRRASLDSQDQLLSLVSAKDEKAAEAARLEREEGNRLFCAGKFEDAKDRYTRGLPLRGVLDDKKNCWRNSTRIVRRLLLNYGISALLPPKLQSSRLLGTKRTPASPAFIVLKSNIVARALNVKLPRPCC